MKNLSRMSLVKRISLFQIVVILLVMGAFTLVLSSLITRRIEERTENNLKEQVALLVSMMSTYDSVLAQNATVLNGVFRAGFPGDFTLDSATLSNAGGRQVPLLKAGSASVNDDTEIVDRFHRTARADCTVFVRSGDDFVRVSTSILDGNGNRIVGTLLDRAHPAYSSLIAGQSFTGKATIGERDYMTSYVPIQDAQGKTVAALAVMVDFTAGLKALADRIVKIEIGKTGYIYAMDAKPGNEQGTLRIHPTLTGKNIIRSKDAHGVEFFRDMIERKQGVMRYWWINRALGETRAREKIVAFDYLREWDWVFVAGSYRDELNTEGLFLRNAMLTATLLVTLVLVSMFVVMLRRWVSHPLQKALRMTKLMAAGDFREIDTIRMDEQETENEVAQLEQGINAMAQSLCGLLAKVRDAAAQLTDASQVIAASARRSSETSENQSGKTTQVATAMLEMSATVEEVSKNSREAAEAARTAASTARDGGKVVGEALSAMSQIAASTDNVSARIAELGQSSSQIGAIASVISEIAGQTNLLALNAAIEAARAGQHGKGFAVVADEVRTLAETSEKSARDIQELIVQIQRDVKVIAEGIQNSSAAAREEMVKGKKTIDGLDQVRGEMAEVIAGSREIARGAEESNVAAREAQKGAEVIAAAAQEQGSACEETRKTVEQQTQALTQSEQTAQELSELAEELKNSTDIAKSAEEVASAAEELSSAVEEINRAAAQITTALDQISRGAQQQSAASQESAAAIAQIEKGAQTSQTLAQAGLEKGQAISDLLGVNKVAVDELVEGVTLSVEAGRKSREQIIGLEQISRRIDKIVDAINTVSIQTNMLAVNGSVEAARAGEFGKGFAVVSTDIRNLARESAENADRIKDTVKAIQDQIVSVRGDLAEIVEASVVEVEKNRQIASSLETVAKDMAVVLAGNKEILAGSEEILRVTKEVQTGVEQVAAAAQEAGQATAEATDAAKEQAKGTVELASAIEEIASLADELQAAA